MIKSFNLGFWVVEGEKYQLKKNVFWYISNELQAILLSMI